MNNKVAAIALGAIAALFALSFLVPQSANRSSPASEQRSLTYPKLAAE
jgi:hypothetical protein